MVSFKQGWHRTHDGYSFRFARWSSGCSKLLVCFPGYTLDELIFASLADSLSGDWDLLAINPYLFKTKSALPPADLSLEISFFIGSFSYEHYALLGHSMGFHLCIHLFKYIGANTRRIIGVSPVWLPHNVADRLPITLQKMIYAFLGSSIFCCLLKLVCLPFRSPKGLTILRSLVGNSAYVSKALDEVIMRNTSTRRIFSQAVVKPFGVMLGANLNNGTNLPENTIIILYGKNDTFIRYSLKYGKGINYYTSMKTYFGNSCHLQLEIDGGHEGFLEKSSLWNNYIKRALENARSR